MCVIMLAEEKRPSTLMIDRAFDKNPDGGGVAWREGKGKDAEVFWKKGLNRKEMHDLCASLPLPYVAHFRKKSIGPIIPALAHPIPVDKNASLDLEGKTKGYVLFQNGTWHKWDEFTINTAMRTGVHIPPGKWNDTRALAWLCSIIGFGIMDLIETKGVAFSPRGEIEVFEGANGWALVEEMWCSNNEFYNVSVQLPAAYRGHQTYPIQGSGGTSNTPPSKGKVVRVYCITPKCMRKDLDADDLCPLHSKKKVTAELTPTTTPSTVSTVVDILNPHGWAEPTVVERFAKVRGRSQKVSPYEASVVESRSVAQTKGPFQAMGLIDEMLEARPPRISKSQWKKLRIEFLMMQAKRTQAQWELEEAFKALDKDPETLMTLLPRD